MKSGLSFIFSAAASSVGIGNIWRFPELLRKEGGITFFLIYCFILFFIAIPAFVNEIYIGKSKDDILKKSKFGKLLELSTYTTSFLVLIVYTILCSIVLMRCLDIIFNISNQIYQIDGISNLSYENSMYLVACILFVLIICGVILSFGIDKGLVLSSKIGIIIILSGFLFIITYLLVRSPNSFSLFFENIIESRYKFTTKSLIMCLGQALFTLSIGQGTMLTYGKYLRKSEVNANLLGMSIVVAVIDLTVSILATTSLFLIKYNINFDDKDDLFFGITKITFINGQIIKFISLFLMLAVLVAGITSNISVMEPVINKLSKYLKRNHIIFFYVNVIFIIALSFIYMELHSINIISKILFISTCILIPVNTICMCYIGVKNKILDKIYIEICDFTSNNFLKSFLFFIMFLSICFFIPSTILLLMTYAFW